MRNINNSNNRINVDSRNYSTIARFRQEDDATLVVNLYKNGEDFDVSNQTITLRALRVDGQSINQTDNISKNKNIVTINLRRNILNVIGRCSIQLNISDASGQFTTAEFFIEVEKNNLGSDALKGSDNVQALQQILIDFKNEKNSLIKNITDDYNSLKKIIISQNQAADLQNQINLNKQQLVENTNRIEQLEDLTPVWQEHSGAGNITVNDSFDGVTKDLVIRGRTLQNLSDLKTIQVTASGQWSTKRISLSLLKSNTEYTLITKISINTMTVPIRSVMTNPNTYLPTLYKAGEAGIKIQKFTKLEHNYLHFTSEGIGEGEVSIDVMILEGDFTNQPVPNSHFDSITSAGELEGNKIKIKSVGKNLFNPALIHRDKSINFLDGSMNTVNGYDCVDYTAIYNLKTITISNCGGVSSSGSQGVAFYDSVKNFISGIGKLGNQSISVPNGAKYVRFSIKKSDKVAIDNAQIEEGSIATNHEQYRSKLIEIPLPFAKGLKSTLDGTIFDEINGNTGEIIQRVSDEYTALAKPIIHKINDIQLKTFDETTHITQENNILSDISFKAKVSLSSQAKRLTEENKALKEENRELREDTNVIVDSLISFFGPMLLPADDVGGDQKIILEKLYEIRNR